MKKFIITMGLPGSGKTSWCKKEKEKHIDCQYIDVDYYIKNSMYSGSEKERLEKMLLDKLDYRNNVIILDGLFTIEDDIKFIIDNLQQDKIRQFDIEIHFWEENRKACLWNDRYRRDQTSTFSINNLKLEEPNVKVLDEYLTSKEISSDIRLVRHLVQYKSNLQMFIDKYKIPAVDGNLVSDTWTLGGESWNYAGKRSKLDPEVSLESFEEFDELLLQINPSISFIQYKKIYKEAVSIEEKDIRDYYCSGREAYYCCDLKSLLNILEKMELVEIEQI